MNYFKIFKGVFLAVICGAVAIPGWINYFDNGLDTLTVSELQEKTRSLNSLNLQLRGKLLFDHLCEYTEYKDDSLYNHLYYIPVVPLDWQKGDLVKSVLILDSGKRGFDEGFIDETKRLELKIDSLKEIQEDMTLRVVYNKYDILKFEDKAMNCLRRGQDLNIASNFKLKKLVYNEKHSLMGKIFITCLAILICGWLFFQVSFKPKEEEINEYEDFE